MRRSPGIWDKRIPMKPVFLELFSGSGQMSEAAKQAGFEVVSIDNVEEYNPTHCFDIKSLTAEHIIQLCGSRPAVIWASPPCTKFSVARIGDNWKHRQPRNQETLDAIALVEHAINLIKSLKPTFYFIENPRGMLRTLPIMLYSLRRTVTYCQYLKHLPRDKRPMKPTDIWTNSKLRFKSCNYGDLCHVPVPRSSHAGIQGMSNAHERGKIPMELCRHVTTWAFQHLDDPGARSIQMTLV